MICCFVDVGAEKIVFFGWILCRKAEVSDGGVVEDGKVRRVISIAFIDGNRCSWVLSFSGEILHAKSVLIIGSGWRIGAEA